jgi:hypothetical protein
MKKPKIIMTIIKEDTGYSATAEIGKKFIGTQGEDYNELTDNIVEAVNLAFKKEGYIYKLSEIKIAYDMESFFQFFKVINAKAFSERIGINQSLLAQYIHGHKKPSDAQKKKILTGVQQLGRELAAVSF